MLLLIPLLLYPAGANKNRIPTSTDRHLKLIPTMKVSPLLQLLLALLAVSQVAGQTDTDILNFALSLECLEAQFYSCAATGQPLSAELTANGPAPIGCKKANLTVPFQLYANEIAQDETNHVKLLRGALGSAAVPCPLVDIGPAFGAAANAAFNKTLIPPFDPYANNIFFLHGGFIFEDVGVTAYAGAAPLITSKDYLGTAARILAVEAYHAAILRTLLSQIANVTVVPYGVQVYQIVDAISKLRGTVDGSNGQDDQGIIFNGTVNLVPTDNNGLVFTRTAAQVLPIVYLGGKGGGGFFPDGLNGSIK
ncbi:hypothetical protein WJX72_007829 [[Myrmecia] bisecta]|uniref:Desiccation-related protein PCC13-62 n=1 Tax=[Myrmecia] bisecta TaxID=41462 RepID=A0AAW1PE43_9CHLO